MDSIIGYDFKKKNSGNDLPKSPEMFPKKGKMFPTLFIRLRRRPGFWPWGSIFNHHELPYHNLNGVSSYGKKEFKICFLDVTAGLKYRWIFYPKKKISTSFR